MVERKKITVGTWQPHISYSVKTVSRTLQEQKSSFQILSTATLQLPFQLQEQPFQLTHELEWMQALASLSHPMQAAAVPRWPQPSIPAQP